MLRRPLLGSRICALRPLSQTAVTYLPLVYSTKPRIIKFGIPLNDYYQIRFTYVTSKTLPETWKLIIHKWNLIFLRENVLGSYSNWSRILVTIDVECCRPDVTNFRQYQNEVQGRPWLFLRLCPNLSLVKALHILSADLRASKWFIAGLKLSENTQHIGQQIYNSFAQQMR